MLILASQNVDNIPFIHGKVLISDYNGVISLKMNINNNLIDCEYRQLNKDESWTPMNRGISWLYQDEINSNQHLGDHSMNNLSIGDERCLHLATTTINILNWNIGLLAEQWNELIHIPISNIFVTY